MNEVNSLLPKNKRMMSAEFVSKHLFLFACPICHSSMKVFELKSLVCSNQHTFDFAKQGYINLTTGQIKTKYSKELFEARRTLMTESTFFKPVVETIAKLINKEGIQAKKELSIIDMGCGEGSHLASICDLVSAKGNKKVVGVGIDLAKEGVVVAAKNYSENKLWAVADLARTPFINKQFDVILNILSPSNYAEFNRLLKEDGLVIKVIPQTDYLKELRDYFFHETEKQTYSNEETVERFQDSFRFVDSSRLRYRDHLNGPLIWPLVQMTPLTWGITDKQAASFLEKESIVVSIDLEIMIGRK